MREDSERSRLVLAYYDALQTYSRAVRALAGLRPDEFPAALEKSEAARAICEQRRLELERYEQSSGATAAD